MPHVETWVSYCSLPRELLVAAVAGTVPSNWSTVQRRMYVKGLQTVAVDLCKAVRSPAPVL